MIKAVIYDMDDFFNVVISGDDVVKGKPEPEIYLLCCKKLGFKPEECLVLEDSEKGIISAKSAGCKCIAVKNKNTLEENTSMADLVIDSLDEINIKRINSIE